MIGFKKLLTSGKTVRRIADIQLLLGITDKSYARLVLHRAKKQGVLVSPAPGIFCLPTYDHLEFASKVRVGSYISFETVLWKHGVIFQSYIHTTTLASMNSLEKKIGSDTYVYHKLADSILYNPLGITNHKNNYLIASPERALADLVYLTGNIYVDNLSSINTEKLLKIAEIYNKTTLLHLTHLVNNASKRNA